MSIERDYVRFEVSESQGSVFNKTMRKYEFDKLEKIDTTELLEQNRMNNKGRLSFSVGHNIHNFHTRWLSFRITHCVYTTNMGPSVCN